MIRQREAARLVPPTRIERATRGLGNRCSIQLSYGGVGLRYSKPGGLSTNETRQPEEHPLAPAVLLRGWVRWLTLIGLVALAAFQSQHALPG